ncbi:MAG: hypothetical protein AB8H47_28030, partial [Bacteroidia bacterium]
EGTASQNVSFDQFVGNVLSLDGADMGSGDLYDFRLDMTANCEALDFFFFFFSFQDTIYVRLNTNQVAVDSTTEFNNAIAYPELSMPQPATPNAAVGQTVTRSVTINNSGNGCLRNFFWYDAFGPDVSVDSVYFQGVKLNTTTNGDTIFYAFSETEFVQMGDSNNVFCIGDNGLEILEYLKLKGCADKSSDLFVGWGCESDTCNTYSTTADVSFVSLPPSLTFTFREAELPACFHEQPNRKEMIVVNQGYGAANDIEIEVKKFYYAGQFAIYKYDGIDASSVEMKVGNGSFVSQTPKYLEANTYYNSCSQPYSYRFRLDVPDMEPGDSVVIAFDMINCAPDDCGEGEIRQGAWGYNYRYTLPCVGSSTVVDNQYGGLGSISTFVGNNYDNPTISQGQEVILTTMVQEAQQSYPGDGRYVVRFELPPCGMDFSGTASDLSWNNIAGGLAWPQASFSQTADTIEATFNLSDQPTSFDMDGSEINLIVTGDCDCVSGDTLQAIRKTIKYIPEISCSNPTELELYCEDISIAVDPCSSNSCDGLETESFSFYRRNYGENDDDGNRLSNSSSPTLSQIRLDRVRLGDTLTASMQGVIIGSTNFDYGYAQLIIDLGQYISPAGASLRLYDASSASYFTCDSIPFSQTDDTLFVADFSSNTIASYCADFNSFQFAVGDSVWVSANLKISSTSTNDLDVGYVNPMDMYVSNVANPTDAQKAGCGSASFSDKFQIVPMTDGSFVNSVLSSACGQTQARTYLNFFTAGSYLDMFPYEYRKWSFPDTIIVTPPLDYDFVNAYLLLRYSPYVNTQYISPAYSSVDTLLFDLSALVAANSLIEPDDGYELQFFTTWEPQCYAVHNVAIRIPTEVIMHWEEGLEAYAAPSSYSPEIQHNAPALELSNVSGSTQDGLSESVEWIIGISNTTLNSAAPYSFLSFYSPSGEISVSSVTNSGGSALTESNGIYQLGTLSANSSQQYSINASYSSCSLDTLYVYAGWNCDSFPTTLSAFLCEIDTFIFRVDPQPSAVQLNVTNQPSGSISLCQNLDYTFAITSTQMANVVDLAIEVYHNNSGLDWVNGTAEIEYPSGTGYRVVTDPDSIAGGFRFTLGDYDATLDSEGLEGLGGSSAANRTANIRFNTQANCDFLSGDVFYVRLTGAQPCGSPISVLRVMDPVSVTGVLAPYNTTITNNASTLEGCSQNHDFRIKVVPDGTTASGDKIRLSVPADVTYVSNSFTALRNAPTAGSMTSTSLGSLGTRYVWDMPSSIAAGDSIIFLIQLTTTNNAACSSDELLATVQTIFDANVVCGGSNCPDYYGSSGSASTYLTIDKPDLSVDQLSSSVSASGTDYLFGLNWVLQNAGSAINAVQTTVEFYLDLDSSLSFSVGDRYFGAYSHTLSIADGGSQSLNTTLTVDQDSADLSKALLAIVRRDPGNSAGPSQCLCDSLSFAASMDVVLPLLWQDIRVTAGPNANTLMWEAIIESGYFTVERKLLNEETWQDITQLATQKNTSQQDFRYADPSNASIAYYRVRHTDASGLSNWSPVVYAQRDQGYLVQLQPNPAKDWLELNTPIAGSYRLLDMQGRTLKQGALPTGRSRIEIKNIAAGFYLMEVDVENIRQNWKLEIR